MPPIWEATVQELMTSMHDALVALVPVFDRTGICWRDGTQYDEFDNVAEAIFDSAFCSAVRNLYPSASLLRYGFGAENFSNQDYVSVTCTSVGESGAFLDFATTNEPFDSIRVVPVDDVNRTVRIPYKEAQFVLMIRTADGGHARVDRVTEAPDVRGKSRGGT